MKTFHWGWLTVWERGLVHCHHGGEHGRTQADMVWEREPRVLHLDCPAAGGEGHGAWLEHLKLQSTTLPRPMTHFPQQGCTYSNKAILPNAAPEAVLYIRAWGPFSFKPAHLRTKYLHRKKLFLVLGWTLFFSGLWTQTEVLVCPRSQDLWLLDGNFLSLWLSENRFWEFVSIRHKLILIFLKTYLVI